jgi:hypothetical protein
MNFDGLTGHARELVKFKHNCFFGQFNLPEPLQLSSPPKTWGARPLDRVHLGQLKTSFQANAAVNERVEVVVINTALYNHHQAQMHLAAQDFYGGSGAVSEKNNIGLDVLWENKDTSPLYVIAGNHTRVAIGELKVEFPYQKLFALNGAVFYLCPDNAETLYVLSLMLFDTPGHAHRPRAHTHTHTFPPTHPQFLFLHSANRKN